MLAKKRAREVAVLREAFRLPRIDILFSNNFIKMMKIYHYCVFPLTVALVLFVGCSDKVRMAGKVTFSDDGTPVPVGTVFFENDTFMARGTIRSDGTFSVSSTSHNDGLPPGKYRVSINEAKKQIGMDKNNMPVYEELIDSKYGDASISGLSLEVTSSTKSYNIKVDRAQAAKKTGR